MPHFEFEIKPADGTRLQGQGWEPDGEIKAVVCLVHGLGEHSGRYDHVAEAFNRAGLAVLAFDLRGHGRSAGKRGHAPSYAVLMEDTALFLDQAPERYPALPVFLYGHSLGGNLAIHFALRKKPPLAGIVASSPLLRLAYAPPAWKTMLLETMYALRIKWSIPRGEDDTALSHDQNVVRAKRNDPLCHGRVTAQLAVEMLRNGDWNLAHAAGFPCPLLLMHGDADRITSAEATKEFALQAKACCTLKIWDGFFHELHNEPGKNLVLAFALDWMANIGVPH